MTEPGLIASTLCCEFDHQMAVPVRMGPPAATQGGFVFYENKIKS